MIREEREAAHHAETRELEEEAARWLEIAQGLMTDYRQLRAGAETYWDRRGLEQKITVTLHAACDCWEKARAGVIEYEGGGLRRVWVRSRRG